MELLGIKGEYKKSGQRINIFLLNINLKMYYIQYFIKLEIFCKFFSYFNVEQTLLQIKAFSHTVNLSHSCCFLSLLAIFASWCQNLKILPLRKKIYQNTSENDGIIGKYNPCILLPNIVTKYILIHGKNLTFIANKEFKL